MRQKIVPGGEIEALTPLEAAELLSHLYREEVEDRVRGAATIQLDANGNGIDEVYGPPVGFEFEARRISVDLSTATDPGSGSVILAGSAAALTQAIGGATAAAPPANTAVATPGTLPRGFYSGLVTTWESGTPDANLTNMKFTAGGTTLVLGLPSTATPTQTVIPRFFSDGINGVGVLTGNAAGGAGAIYNAEFEWTPLDLDAVSLEYLRSGVRICWAQPAYGPNLQIPGVETWGDEQGPYIRNGEVFEVRARGLTANAVLDVTVEGILRRPPSERNGHRGASAVSTRAFGAGAEHPPRPDRAIT